ncbi:DNA-binding protein [Sporosarcina sp. CAU 1771]
MKTMSLAILEETKDDIQEAYQTKSLPKIGKETLYVFDRVVHFMLSAFKDRLKGITFESNEFDFNETYLRSQKNMTHMLNTLEFIQQIKLPVSDFDFGKIKVDVERWHYRMGGEGMYFEYREEYLVTPKMAAESLGVSNVTLNKYMKQGLEVVDTTSHHKIPKHAVELWRDPVYAIRMQMLAQEKKLRNQTPEVRLKEVRDEIIELQKEYKAKTLWEAMAKNKINNIDAVDDPSDFRKWEDLEEEQEELLEELIEGSEFV